ncbi:MAG: hypothetical protein K2X82_26670 [Gemmataceae bacterium]|nr:hypothetical protein [Gemmataceae bacterium]
MIVLKPVKWAACLALAVTAAAGAGCSSGRGCRSSGCSADAHGRTAVVPATAPVAALGSASAPQPGPAAQPPTTAAAKYGGQRTCPVMGDVLGEMGEPIPVSVKGQTVYVCCKGCVSKVQRDPDKYLAVVAAERAGR